MPDEIRIDLHDVFNDSGKIDRALEEAFARAERTRARCLQIVHGKGSGQLKKRVQRFVQQPHVRTVTRSVDNDAKNWGRMFIYFRWPDTRTG